MKKLIKVFVAISLVVVMALSLVACDKKSSTTTSEEQGFTNPGDRLNGGQEATAPTIINIDSSVSEIVTAGESDFVDSAITTDSVDATALQNTDVITKAGSYILTGDYTNGIIDFNIKKDSEVHIFLNGANISSASTSAIIKTDKRIKLIITVVDGTENTITCTASENALAVKGTLYINGAGTLNVNANGEESTAIKVSKGVVIEDATININATKHGISAESISADSATINVLSAKKDGLHAECDYDNDEGTNDYTYTTDSGYIKLFDVKYSADVMGDGIQADTYVYIDGGEYNITTTAVFVADTTANRTTYGLVSDDFKYIKSGKNYVRVASDYTGNSVKYAMAQGTKGIKVGEIEYDTDGDDVEDVTIYDGDYTIYIKDATMTLNSDDDGIHANSGNVIIESGIFTIETYDDGITADNYTKINGGTISIPTCYEGIEGGYVEINGGTINIVSSDDGINAASDDTSVNEYIYITGGKITIDATGDGIDSNGAVWITGGELIVNGPTSGADSGLDSESGILVDGGIVVASSTLGMVETPAKNSAQYILSYAQSTTISAGTSLIIKDADGNTLYTFNVSKNCQSVIISLPAFENGKTYSIYGGETLLSSFTISGIITSVGSTNSAGGMGGQGGPGGQGGFDPNGQGGQGGPGGQGGTPPSGFDPNGQGGQGGTPPSGFDPNSQGGQGGTPPTPPEQI